MSDLVMPVPEIADPQGISHYHAHLYFDSAAARQRAAIVRDRLAASFPEARLGNWHDKPVGPHTRAMYQVAFQPGLLPTLLPWLMLNRLGLAVLVHPETGNDYRDHTRHAAWLGEILPLNTEVLKGDRD